MKIKLSDIDKKPCAEYYDYIKDKYGDGEFNPIDVITRLNGDYVDVQWLIANCKKAQTKQMLEFYMSFNRHTYSRVSWLIVGYEFAQTKEMLEFYKSLKPHMLDVEWLIKHSEFAKENRELIED